MQNCHNGAQKSCYNNQTNSCIVKCPSCSSKLRICATEKNPMIKIGDIICCDFCGIKFPILKNSDPTIFLTITCPSCSKKSRISANQGKVSVTCHYCKDKFIVDSGTWPTTTATPKKQSRKEHKERFEPINLEQNALPKSNIFDNISNHFKDRKADIEKECKLISQCALTDYIGHIIQNALNDFRPQIASYGTRSHFNLSIHKNFFFLTFYYYDKEEKQHSKELLTYDYKYIKEILKVDEFDQIQSREARKCLDNIIYREYILNTGFLIRANPDFDKRIGILRSKL